VLESQKLHKLVILLIVIDSACVLADLGYTLLQNQTCTPEGGRVDIPDPTWLTVLSHISLGITTLFLIELPLQLWAFGLRYYNPVPRGEDGERNRVVFGWLHLFDAVVIVTTFILEVVLRGRQRELAGLLILLRLWRLVKLVGGVAVGAGEIGEEDAQALADLRRELEDTKAALTEAIDKNRVLRQRLGSGVNGQYDYYAGTN